MNNNVVLSLYEILGRAGFPVLRFNFNSFPSLTGSSERLDLKCVVNSQIEKGVTSLVLIGYSYGAMISGSLVNEIPQLLAFIAVSYPFSGKLLLKKILNTRAITNTTHYASSHSL